MPRNDDISLIIAKAKMNGNFPDVKDEELDAIEQYAKTLFGDDAALTASYAESGASRTPAAINGIGFNMATIDAPTDGANYASFPATCDTIDGSLLVVWRASSAHNFVAAGDAGRLYIASSDDGSAWSPRQLLRDETPTYDLRDPCLYRVPGEQRIYLTYTKFAVGSDNTPGIFVSYSDDNGKTFSAGQSVRASTSAGIHMRKMADGTWRLPAFEIRAGTDYQAILLTATNPLGPWTKQAVIYGDPAGSNSESDLVEITATNWVAVVRGDGASNQAKVVQSTDKGATWSAPTALPGTAANYFYQGWPTFLKTAGGRVLLFARVTGSGLRVVQLVDQAAPLTAASWSESGINGIFGDNLVTSGGGFVGKFVPIVAGSTVRGAYMSETSPSVSAEIRFGGFSLDTLNMQVSHIATAEKIADESPVGYVALTTPDTVTFWTPGGMHKIEYQTRSYQVSGTVSTFQHDVEIDGTLQGLSAQWYMPVTGSTVGTVNVSYPAMGRWGYKWLPRGKHTVTLKYRMDSTTIGRTFADRTLAVTLVS